MGERFEQVHPFELRLLGVDHHAPFAQHPVAFIDDVVDRL